MTEQTSKFELVAIHRDGTPGDAMIELSPDDRKACQSIAGPYEKLGFAPPWLGYVTVVDGRAVGGCAFVGPPAEKRVEIAYFTAPQHQGKGYATLAARRLAEIARETAPDVQLWAKTEPQQNASTAILTRLGFTQAGSTRDEEIGDAWLWVLS